MTRLLLIAALVILGCRMLTGRWPWEILQGSATRSQAVRRARRLLGIGPNPSREDILDAHRKLVSVVHPDRGGTNEQVHEANAARDLLLDELQGRKPLNEP